MDTRRKILTAAEAHLLPGPVTVVAAYFDALRAAEIEEIAASKTSIPLLAVVLPRPGGLLPMRARAELAAALAVVDYVVTTEDEDAEALLRFLPASRVVRLEHTGELRVQELIRHVRLRHNQ